MTRFSDPAIRLLLAAAFGSAGILSSGAVAAAAPAIDPVPARGMVDGNPCPVLPDASATRDALTEYFLKPGPIDLAAVMALSRDPAYTAYQQAKEARDTRDWPGLCVYRDANRELIAAGQRPSVVMFGDSITENWVKGDPGLFAGAIVGRGIGGQTSAQMFARFRADVIALRPAAVHILAGTNDVAGNAGPTTEEDYRNNIRSMVELAQAHRIRVVFGAIPPSRRFFWAPELTPAPRIVALNAWLRGYAKEQRIPFVDYHDALAAPDGGMKPDLANDGVHPNRTGYALMRQRLQPVLDKLGR